ncbi:MAG: hypothetical protein QF632_00140 [Candidatus Woesearchaeota archaeon]|jgi:hypothetical protein|nr:hypothetical protein [Candidatus Woesearchaeota archaeon]MDP7323150.1 hypothetical protein [Candidatus Woesearchaeota archaeon]MDP7457884.1 hypothetical protein [Candidatus Woesearchaeota archaeon]
MKKLTKHQLKLQKQKLESHKAHEEHEEREQFHESIHEEKSKKKKSMGMMVGIVGVIVLIIIAVPVYSYYFRPGPVDGFAKCLSDAGAVMYGADFCQYTKGQIAMFGRSIKHIDYRDFTNGPEIKITPTWIIKGEKIENAQSFDKLAALTGCSMPV